MFCINCGKPYEPSHKFCNYCGYPVPQSGEPQEDDRAAEPIVAAAAPEAIAEAPGSSGRELPTVTSTPMPAVESAPYARFVSLVLAFVLLISVLAFNIAEAFVRNRWGNTVLSVVVLLGASLLARSANGAWRRVVAAEPEADVTLKHRHRRVLRNSVIISLLFLAIAAVVGAAIGKSRDEAIQLAADLERMNTVGDRISKARSSVEATIASYVDMYKSIGPDVQDLESTLTRLKTELRVYDGKFPAQHEQTAKSIAGMDTGLRRMALLKQQIEVAKQIEALGPSDQVTAWRTLMLPLLAEEDAIDKAK